ncbi:hypothetical protein PENARI_c046G11472 [Penicillium arizonense]|uniref:Jacalin-type lectin domain-containing protein n=1 Tax=Penicillium arizonense TaxID=1835702 RepID=A0A1F5L2C4_PENAI|nr:hypothetical protein PENARI_c046G11472 [Penicillium arizonense]OGE47383.1 hypothetical protein PENARI_c046G11472 [Penicillium arizonense]
MVQKGPAVGGDGGSPFDLLNGNRPVEQLDVWYGSGSGDADRYIVLKGIKVRWPDGKTGQVGSCPPGDQPSPLHTSFDFERNGNDPLDWMDIYGSTGRADSLRLVTHDETDYFEAGGIGGGKCIQPAQGRKLYGFYGRAGFDIDKLGAYFSD